MNLKILCFRRQAFCSLITVAFLGSPLPLGAASQVVRATFDDSTYSGSIRAGVDPIDSDTVYSALLSFSNGGTEQHRRWGALQRPDGSIVYNAFVNEPLLPLNDHPNSGVSPYGDRALALAAMKNGNSKLGLYDLNETWPTPIREIEYIAPLPNVAHLLETHRLSLDASEPPPTTLIEDRGDSVHLVAFDGELQVSFDRSYEIPFVLDSSLPSFVRFEVIRLPDESGYYLFYRGDRETEPFFGLISLNENGVVQWSRSYTLEQVALESLSMQARVLPDNSIALLAAGELNGFAENYLLWVEGTGELRWGRKLSGLSLANSLFSGFFGEFGPNPIDPYLWIPGQQFIEQDDIFGVGVILGLNPDTGAIEKQRRFKDAYKGIFGIMEATDDSLFISHAKMPPSPFEQTFSAHRLDFDLQHQAGVVLTQETSEFLLMREFAPGKFSSNQSLPNPDETIHWILDRNFNLLDAPCGEQFDLFESSPDPLTDSAHTSSAADVIVNSHNIPSLNMDSTVVPSTIEFQSIDFTRERTICSKDLPDFKIEKIPGQDEVRLFFRTLLDAPYSVLFGGTLADLTDSPTTLETGIGTGDVEVRTYPRDGRTAFWRVLFELTSAL